MKQLLMLFISFFMLMSCSPTIQLLQEYELAKELKNDVLFVPLVDDSEEIALLRKYGQNGKADRMQRRMEKANATTKEAFVKSYNFSLVKFVSEHEIENYNFQFSVLTEEDVYSDQNNYLTTAKVYSAEADNAIEVKDETTSSTTTNLAYVLKLLNKKLVKYSEK